MGAIVKVLDRNNGKPKDYVEVIVSWVSGGTSSGRTDAQGNVDVGSAGTANYVWVDGKKVETDVWLEGTFTVRI